MRELLRTIAGGLLFAALILLSYYVPLIIFAK